MSVFFAAHRVTPFGTSVCLLNVWRNTKHQIHCKIRNIFPDDEDVSDNYILDKRNPSPHLQISGSFPEKKLHWSSKWGCHTMGIHLKFSTYPRQPLFFGMEVQKITKFLSISKNTLDYPKLTTSATKRVWQHRFLQKARRDSYGIPSQNLPILYVF